MGGCNPALVLFQAAPSQRSVMAPGCHMDGWDRVRSGLGRNCFGFHAAAAFTAISSFEDLVLYPVFGMDAVALHHRICLRRRHVYLGVQRDVVDGTLGMGLRRRT